MAYSKKKKPSKQKPKTVKCPAHGQDIEIVYSENGRIAKATCTCDVPSDKHTGRVVYEHKY